MKISPRARLVLLALFLTALWFGAGFGGEAAEDARMWRTVRAGQRALWDRQMAVGVPLSELDDRLRTGFIGVEWSDMTTTLGPLAAKRTACDPLWATRYAEWFDEVGLAAGDRVAIYASSSFPGMLFSALVAAEARGLDILLVVSLGSSTWGANRVEFPWPAMHRFLLENGFIRTNAAFYTPGGEDERGANFPPLVSARFSALSAQNHVPLIVPRDFADALAVKTAALDAFRPALFVSIGGAHANLGSVESPGSTAHEWPAGLIRRGVYDDAAFAAMPESVLAHALRAHIPAINVLNLKRLAAEAGIPWDAPRFLHARARGGPFVAVVGLLACAAAMIAHRRWAWEGE